MVLRGWEKERGRMRTNFIYGKREMDLNNDLAELAGQIGMDAEWRKRWDNRIVPNILEICENSARSRDFILWLIGELIKGELGSEEVMDKLVEFGFAECKDGYVTIKIEV